MGATRHALATFVVIDSAGRPHRVAEAQDEIIQNGIVTRSPSYWMMDGKLVRLEGESVINLETGERCVRV